MMQGTPLPHHRHYRHYRHCILKIHTVFYEDAKRRSTRRHRLSWDLPIPTPNLDTGCGTSSLLASRVRFDATLKHHENTCPGCATSIHHSNSTFLAMAASNMQAPTRPPNIFRCGPGFIESWPRNESIKVERNVASPACCGTTLFQLQGAAAPCRFGAPLNE
ncbi:hypothetical protein K431DRAFT_68801 [Polychaeton citri CBS 116435]|uniref:Uncharacterized protein n=1 Tax=Polychaeton citri CBS 116435 TaxID=1314669 RepID=A0A9P4QBF1_9PEZI|nr:hypothetical protein K431DRAFT_68801 [Polychaeton citri CBS 116435]